MKKFAILGCLLFVGCTEKNRGFDPDPQLPGECRAGEEVVEIFEDFEVSKQVDILFVVDNSGDTGELQKVLAEAVPGFLSTFEDAGKEVIVAVATTDPRNSGLADPGQMGDGCAGNNTSVPDSEEQEQWKEIAACNVVLETTEDQPDTIFTTVQKVVVSGGFWRDRSQKLVVVVTRDDDCSSNNGVVGDQPREACIASNDLTDVAAFVEFVESSPSTPEGLTVAFVGGPSSVDVDSVRPVCNSRIGPVFAGNRVQEAADGLGAQSLVRNVCSEDLTPALQSIANQVITSGSTLCTSRKMAHEPLRVVDQEDAEVRVGDGGFVFLGTQPECENGALVFDDDSLTEIEVTYCAL